MKNCAILTMDSLSDFECYDNFLDKPLADLGWQTHLVPWRNKKVNWQQFDAVVIRSPWDYQDDANAFISVLKEINHTNTILLNSLVTVCWNIDKIYLKSLAEHQVNIVPTSWEKNVSRQDLVRFFNDFNCQQLVIKPRISANADNTFLLAKDTCEQFYSTLESFFGQAEFMVQPFMNSVVDEGEFSLFYFDGSYSHAILKTPKENDFRVQEEHGGKLQTITPEKVLLTQAEHALAVITQLTGEIPLYARLDFVRDKTGNLTEAFALMEAELIEPSLYFNMDEKSAQNFANAFVKRMNKNK
jgi:glutathione synthase/RimK-type ligase-like ATP-grasp enzyme